VSTHYPIFLDVHDREVVIVGGGTVAARKAETLLAHGARVSVVAPECVDAIANDSAIAWKKKTYDADDVSDAFLVIAATNIAAVNEQIARDCRERRVLVNVADDATLGDFILPAIVDKGSIQIAVSTGGRSPAFARAVKRDIARAIGDEYAEVNELLGSLREAAKDSPQLPTDGDRKRFFDELIAIGLVDMLRAGRRRDAYRAVADACEANGVALSDVLRSGLDA